MEWFCNKCQTIHYKPKVAKTKDKYYVVCSCGKTEEVSKEYYEVAK